ncbi:MAG: acetate/propionate family kinase [Candidatus Brocadiia bacterium]
MNILVFNCGSSSIKYQLFDMPAERLRARGIVERIGEQGTTASHTAGGDTRRREVDVPDHEAGIAHIRDALMDPQGGVVGSPDAIDAVGHRVVHGGERFVESTLITEAVIEAVEDFARLAPLHNPPNLVGIRGAAKAFPGRPQVAVFDTAFHQTMPRHAFIYALPYELYAQDGIRRYGFHGTSHRFVAARAAQLLDLPPDQLRAITCHLGNGCSMTAVAGGKSVDTSLGFTPLEGLVMGTRSGDIDPAIVFYLARNKGYSLDQLDELLNKRSGLLGLSGISNDVRTLLDAAEGNERARLALDVFCYRVRKYLGAYLAVLGSAHAVVFTGGIGENAASLRRQMVAGLEGLGIQLDAEANEGAMGEEAEISAPGSPIRLLVVPTNEELMIARDTFAIAGGEPA